MSSAGAMDELLTEAILAFDAGNHAWGRYRHFVLPAAAAAQGISTAAVRDALAEAANGVVEAREGDATGLITGLRQALAGIRLYRAALPAGVQQSELEEAEGDLAEALALLENAALPPG